MGMHIDVQMESGVLRVEASGKFSLQEAKRIFLEMLESVARYRTDKVLFDGRKLTGKPETIERFIYGEFAARSFLDSIQRGTPAGTRFSYILKEPVLDPKRFGELVALNRGMPVRAFDNPDDAVSWLEMALPHSKASEDN